MKSPTNRLERLNPVRLGRPKSEHRDRKGNLPVRWVLPCLTLLATAAAGVAAARTNDVWLTGIPPWVRAHSFNDPSPSDYLDMFKPDAPWSKSAGRLRVFQTTGGLINRESDETLQKVFADLKRRHIAFAMELGLATARQDSTGHQACGVNVEGITTPNATRVIAERIKKNGGELRYVAMDEPLWYGHHYNGKNACGFTLSELAAAIAPNVAVLREYFPSVEIGDVEPIAPPSQQAADWTDQVIAWTRTWRQVIGQPLAFVRADVAWTGPWRQELPTLKRKLHAEGLKYSLIYDGGGTGRTETDEVWTQEAAERFRAVEADPQMAPDQAVIQTWVRWPSHMLPETQSGTLTNLLLQYLSLPPSGGRGDDEH